MSDASQTDQVTLKPFLGLRPGVWLFILYALILAVILFFLLLHPGIARPGSLVSVSTEPFGAAVRVDGVYRGTSPCDIPVPRGSHRFELRLPGFGSRVLEREIPGRLLGSRFFPRRVRIEEKLVADDPPQVLRLAAGEYAGWTFAGEPIATWQIPQVLSEGAYRAGPAAKDPEMRDEMNRILAGAMGYLTTRAALRDFLRARFLLDNGGLAPSPVSILRSGRELLALAESAPGAAAVLAGFLEGDALSRLAGSSWYAGTSGGAGELRAGAVPAGGSGGLPARLSLGGLEFVYVRPGELVSASGFPRRTEIEGFWISRAEADPAAWEAFLKDNPAWAAGERETLVREGLVNSGYLENFPLPAKAGSPASAGSPAFAGGGIHGVSWHAAKAWCRWAGASLGQALPRDLPGGAALELRLPTEDEWEYAARLQEAPGGPALAGMSGGLWEWCDDGFVPLNFLVGDDIPSPERNIRGGSWINPPGTVNAGTRASLSPESCSPFVGFRPVIAGARGARP